MFFSNSFSRDFVQSGKNFTAADYSKSDKSVEKFEGGDRKDRDARKLNSTGLTLKLIKKMLNFSCVIPSQLLYYKPLNISFIIVTLCLKMNVNPLKLNFPASHKLLKNPQIFTNLNSDFASTAKTQLPRREDILYLWPQSEDWM